MSDLLDIITSEETNQSGKLYINGSGESAIISYKNSGKIIGISEGSSRFRPIHCSELDLKLKKRGYNIMGTKFIRRTISGSLPSPSLAELWYDPTKPTTQIPQIPTFKNDRQDELHVGSFKISGSDYPEDLIQEEYNSIFGENMNTNNNEVKFYSSSMSSINLIEDIVELELIKHDSDTYTNVIDISDLIYYNSKPGTSGIFNVTIEYSKFGNVYVRDLSFEAFKYVSENNESPVLIVDNYIAEFNNDVQVEYVNNTIRVNPMSSEIDECILSRCMITYGNL
jgi:hypothetical protein